MSCTFLSFIFHLQMPAWFDIRGLGPSSSEDEDGIVKAAAALNQLIDKEIAAGIPANRIVIGEVAIVVVVVVLTTIFTCTLRTLWCLFCFT